MGVGMIHSRKMLNLPRSWEPYYALGKEISESPTDSLFLRRVLAEYLYKVVPEFGALPEKELKKNLV
jgi:hypothetical protein